ncbi:MAG: hypothetical protein E7507_03410 [Ruminococcus sp.]|nr:hypothetical protein [Ruminococcus sp.]
MKKSFMNELKRNVQNVDYDAFEAMYDRNRFNDTAIKSDRDYFYSRFTGAEVHNVDCTATAFSNAEIVFDFILYWGVSDSAKQMHQVKSAK